jgi:hypothetical protein
MRINGELDGEVTTISDLISYRGARPHAALELPAQEGRGCAQALVLRGHNRATADLGVTVLLGRFPPRG